MVAGLALPGALQTPAELSALVAPVPYAPASLKAPSYLFKTTVTLPGTRVPALKVLEPRLLADLPVPSPVTLGLEH